MVDDPIAPPRPVDLLHADVLPDSRMRKRAKGAIGQVQSKRGMMVPIFCANCGVEGGWVPEANMSFAYWTCTPCYHKLGDVVNLYAMPDEVFFEKVKQEQLDVHGRLLAPHELIEVVTADTSALSHLLKAGS